ncbi:MAG: phosphoglycerate dehydrogenase [Planctomycetota bacterium]|nr:phosphoglycerate dehydrogenase [Planctomycetota bacterium]
MTNSHRSPTSTAPAGSHAHAVRSEKILVCDELSPEALEVFHSHGFAAEIAVGLKGAELLAKVADAHALVVRSATKVTAEVIEAAPRLAVVGRAGVGVDNVDVDAATARGVVVMNAPAGNTTTTAELAVSLMLALARNVARADRAVRSGDWKQRGKLLGSEVTGKTLGVVGLGRIGRAVAQRGLGLQMKVVAYDPYLQGQRSPMEGVELLTLDELLAASDFVTLHVPLSDETRNLLSRERLYSMKVGARLINCARGGLVDELALAEALASGQLKGAALDVFETEPPPKDHPLLQRDDVILTPHLGASSEEAQRNVAIEIAQQICDFLLEGVARNAVNLPATSAATLRELAPWLLLAEKLGSCLAQLCDSPLRTIEVSLSGEIARKDASHVRLAVLVGALRKGCDTPLNFVNAPRLAQERGLALLERPDEEALFLHSLIKARATSRDGETHVIGGSVFGREPRIVRIDDHYLDLAPNGPLLVTTHVDQPGVVGMLGTVLGLAHVNISKFELGPASRTTDRLARGFLALSNQPSPEVLAELSRLEPIRNVRLIQL